MRGRALAIAVGVAVVIVLIVMIVEAAGRDQNAVPSATAQAIPVVLPLAASTTTGSVATVLLPMGHLDDPTNTFWELFVRTAGSSRWRLRTPPGVADNGGLVLAVPPSGGWTAGFLTSQDLTFSPISRSTDQGLHWQAGQLPAGLVHAPDTLASAGASQLALVGEQGQTVLSSDGNLSVWTTLTTRQALSRSIPQCALTGITAVAVGPSGRPLLGLACGSRGSPLTVVEGSTGVSGTGARWTPVGPDLGSGGSGVSTTALRLEQTASGTAMLVEEQTPRATSLVAFWGQGTAISWRQSPRLAVPAGWTVEATGIGGGAGQGETVLLGSGSRRTVEVIAGPGSTWDELPAAPASTAVVATVGTETDAMVAAGSLLTVWAWSPGQGSWHRTAATTVAIPYGSSS
jgi:hypothetical protein